MLRVTVDINGDIIHQSAVYNTLERIGKETIYRYLDDRRKTIRHKQSPIPMGGITLAIEILEKDRRKAWKEYHANS